MKIILTLILIYRNAINGYLVACNTLSQINCQNSGYCQWISSSCRSLECHKVTEVRACSGKLLGNLYQKQLCKVAQNVDPKFLNLCIGYKQDTIKWGYLVYPQDNTQKSTYVASSGQLISLIATKKYPGQFKSEILTLNILKAQANDLINIMYGYLQQTNELCDREIPISFLEKAIYESMQQIRDDETITFTSSIPTKTDYYLALWGMTDAFFLKLRSQKISQYISYKYLINFGFANLKMEKLCLDTQFEVFELTWQYQQSGYIEVLVMPGEQFGFDLIHSNVIIIRISDLNGQNMSNQIQLKWIHQSQKIFTSKQIIQIDITKMSIINNISGTCSQLSCDASLILNERKAYIIGDSTIKNCVGRSQSACRLGECTWNDSTGICS